MSKRRNQNYKSTNSNQSNKGTHRSGGKQVASKQGKQTDVCGSQDSVFTSRSNPVTYYTKFATFAQDAANLPFSHPVGAPIPLDFETAVGKFTAPYYTPGVMRLAFMPTVGVSKDFTSPINRSSIRFYTYMRSNQKASASYDHQDITMMMTAMDSCYMYHAMCRRLYGIVRDFTPVNLYYAKALVGACGGIFSDLIDNLQDFRAWINQFAYNLGQYAIPKGMTFFERHQWMCEGLYVDSQTEKAQTYVFVPDGFWKYDNTVATGSQCTYVPFLERGTATAKQYTVKALMEFGDSLLNAISNESDFAMISGDIYNFYGGDVNQLPYVDENYQVLPKYDETVLSQIENATILGQVVQNGQVISQNPAVNQGAIIFTPVLDPAVYRNPSMLNMHKDHPTPDDVIEATRLLAVMGADGEISTCGTEIVVEAKVLLVNPQNGNFRFNPIVTNVKHVNADQSTTYTDMLGVLMDVLQMAQFQHAPQYMVTYSKTPEGGATRYDIVGTSWDTDNVQTIPTDYLSNINIACLLSQFEVSNNRQ